MQAHLTTSSSAAARRVQGCHPCPPGVVWHVPNYLDFCLVTNACPRRLCLAEIRTLIISQIRSNLADTAFSAAGPQI